MKYFYKGTVSSDLEIIKFFVERTIKRLSRIINNSEALFDIRLILNELIMNSALHGNECMSTRFINLTLKINENMLTIQVEDEGEGVDFDLTDYNPTELKSWGRGLVLVNGLSDEFYVDKNRVVSVKRL